MFGFSFGMTTTHPKTAIILTMSHLYSRCHDVPMSFAGLNFSRHSPYLPYLNSPRKSEGRDQILVYTQSLLAEQSTPATFALSDLTALAPRRHGEVSRVKTTDNANLG